MTYITGYQSPFWQDPRTLDAFGRPIQRLPDRPGGVRTWQASSLYGFGADGFGAVPTKLTAYPWMPAKYYSTYALTNPDTIVVHSGDIGAGVAEYLQNPGDDRKVSAHFSWSTKNNGFAQQVPLNKQAWHAGGSTFLGKGLVNARSIGIELPGPWNQNPRSKDQIQKLRALIASLKTSFPTLRWWVRHSQIQSGKRDPGPGITTNDLANLGVVNPVEAATITAKKFSATTMIGALAAGLLAWQVLG